MAFTSRLATKKGVHNHQKERACIDTIADAGSAGEQPAPHGGGGGGGGGGSGGGDGSGGGGEPIVRHLVGDLVKVQGLATTHSQFNGELV